MIFSGSTSFSLLVSGQQHLRSYPPAGPVTEERRLDIFATTPSSSPTVGASDVPSVSPIVTPEYSVLWGQDGENWNTSRLFNFTDVGYMEGNVSIPTWPVCCSVTDFGAVPDDDISDVQAFRDAVANCSQNCAILVPNGRYIIDGQLDITKNNITIRGESRDGAILFFPKHMSEIEGTTRSTTTFITFRSGSHRGIEDLSLMFRDEQKATGYFLDPTLTKQEGSHWWYSGERPLKMSDGEKNSWIRNIYIKNANHAIAVAGFSTNQISVIDVVLDSFNFRTIKDANNVG